MEYKFIRAVGSAHVVAADFNPLNVYITICFESRRLGTYFSITIKSETITTNTSIFVSKIYLSWKKKS